MRYAVVQMQRLKRSLSKLLILPDLEVNTNLRNDGILKAVLSFLVCVRDYMKDHLEKCNRGMHYTFYHM